MIIIGAMASNRVIGSGDGMPWDVPEEYAHFQRLIEGHTIIIGRRSFGGTLFSAGGASIYAQTLPLADTMYLSYIKGRFIGDAHFPEFSVEEWVVEKREDHPRFEFVVYRRTNPSIVAGRP